MTREIKIKVWHSEKKSMSPGMPIPMLAGYIMAAYQTNDLRNLFYLESTGINDKEGTEIYDTFILEDEHGSTFRIYSAVGGFVIKESVWKKNKSALVPSDIMVTESISHAQIISYLQQSCKVIGNIYQNPELIEK